MWGEKSSDKTDIFSLGGENDLILRSFFFNSESFERTYEAFHGSF